MFLNFIGVNEKIINLNAIALIEDNSTETDPIATLTTIDGIEIEITGPDAEALFARAELIMQATDEVLTKLQHAAQPENAI